jgi:putative lipoic acid-binding regulatory protein
VPTQTVQPTTPATTTTTTVTNPTTSPQQTENRELAQRQANSQLYLNFDANLSASTKADLDSLYRRLERENPAQFAQINAALNDRYGQIAAVSNDAALTAAILRVILVERYAPSNYQFRSEQRQAATQAYFQFENQLSSSLRNDLDSFYQRLQSESPAQAERVWKEVEKRYGEVATGQNNTELGRAILYNVLMQWYKPENYQFRSEQRQAETQAYLSADGQLSPETKADIDAFYLELRQTAPQQADRILNEMQQRYGRSATTEQDTALAEAILRGVIRDWYVPANYKGKSSGTVLDPPRPVTPPQEEVQPTTPGDLPSPEQDPNDPNQDKKPDDPLPFPISPEELERIFPNPTRDDRQGENNEPIRVPDPPPVNPSTDPVTTEANQDNQPTENQQQGQENPQGDQPQEGAEEQATEQEQTIEERLNNIRNQLTEPAQAEFDAMRQKEANDRVFLDKLESRNLGDPIQMFEGIAAGKARRSALQAQQEANLKEAKEQIENSDFFDRPEVQDAIQKVNQPEILAALITQELTNQAKAEQYPAEQGYENLENAILYEVVPGYSSVQEWEADNPSGNEKQFIERDGKIYRPAAEIDLMVVHSTDGKPSDIVEIIEVKSGGNRPASDAREQVDKIQPIFQRIQNGEDVFVEHKGQDITDQLNINSANQAKTIIRGPADRQHYTESVGLTVNQIRDWVREIQQSRSQQQSLVTPEQYLANAKWEATRQELRNSVAVLNRKIEQIPTYDSGYPRRIPIENVSSNITERPIHTLTQEDKAFLLTASAQGILQQKGKTTSDGQLFFHGQDYGFVQNGEITEVVRVENYLPLLTYANGEITLHEPLNQEDTRIFLRGYNEMWCMG